MSDRERLFTSSSGAQIQGGNGVDSGDTGAGAVAATGKKAITYSEKYQEGILQQRKAMEKQDEFADNLSKDLQNLKGIALTIGAEGELHNRLLEEISDDVEISNKGIVKETEHIAEVARLSSTRHLWGIIFVLTAVLIILLSIKA